MTRQADEAWHGDVDLDGVELEADEGQCICATVVYRLHYFYWVGSN
jgi:hypothetical protein